MGALLNMQSPFEKTNRFGGGGCLKIRAFRKIFD